MPNFLVGYISIFVSTYQMNPELIGCAVVSRLARRSTNTRSKIPITLFFNSPLFSSLHFKFPVHTTKNSTINIKAKHEVETIGLNL